MNPPQTPMPSASLYQTNTNGANNSIMYQQQQSSHSNTQQYIQINQGGQIHTMSRQQQQQQQQQQYTQQRQDVPSGHRRELQNHNNGSSSSQQQWEMDRVALTQKNHRLAKELVSEQREREREKFMWGWLICKRWGEVDCSYCYVFI